jgi:uncharacterized membrane protein YphA (DoxX/SURF4 family)
VTSQRTFSTFPDGRSGLGLLLLRAIAGGVLAWCGGVWFVSWHDPRIFTMLAAAFELTSGVALLLGYLTPLASVFAALTSLGIAVAWLPIPSGSLDPSAIRLSAGFVAVIAVSLSCLGPGAFSIDARRYGRREIIIPKRPKPSSEE